MKTQCLLVLVLVACTLCGCDTYRYNSDTVISEEGAIERTFDYQYRPWRRKAPVETVEEAAPVEGNNKGTADGAAGGDGGRITDVERLQGGGAAVVEAAPDTTRYVSPLFVMPDRERFVEFEQRRDGLHGVWRSDGRIHSDFRIITPSYTERGAAVWKPEDLPPTADFLREAFNEGQVTCRDLVLIKALTYAEHFHDFYTAAECDEYGDKVIDVTANVFLDALRADLGAEYDISRFEKLASKTLLPLVKKWKQLYVSIYLHGLFADDEEPTPWIERIMCQVRLVPLRLDLMRLGIAVKDPGNIEQLDSALIRWITKQMHVLIVRRDNGEPWPLDAARAYVLAQPEPDSALHLPSVYLESARRLMTERYGEDSYFEAHLYRIYNSLAFTSDHHVFTVSVEVPWPVISLRPKPESVETVDRGTRVEWEFSGVDLFPGGVHLSITCTEPAVDAQRRLFGRTAIETPGQLRRFVTRVGRLQDDEREVFLTALRACVDAGTVEGLASAVHAQLPKEASAESEALRALIRSLEALAASDEGS